MMAAAVGFLARRLCGAVSKQGAEYLVRSILVYCSPGSRFMCCKNQSNLEHLAMELVYNGHMLTCRLAKSRLIRLWGL